MDAFEVKAMSAAAIGMIVVLVVCAIAIAGLVVTLPSVANCFRRLLHPGAGAQGHGAAGGSFAGGHR